MTTTTETPQHFQALQKANRIRLARAATKRAIFDGEISAADLILETPPELERMTLAELLRARRRWGRTRVRKFCNRMAISENRTLERLTDRQRGMLVAELNR